MINETHDPQLKSWVNSANGHLEFPIQNLPFAIFRRANSNEMFRAGVAIGDQVLDLALVSAAGVFSATAQLAAKAAGAASLAGLMAMGAATNSELRLALSRALRSGAAEQSALAGCLIPQQDVEYALPCQIGDYTDFYASIHHATAVGSLFRPDQPLLPNYQWVPVGYHGRSSSIGISGQTFNRPIGQSNLANNKTPSFGPSERLDLELELGIFIGQPSSPGEQINIDTAEDHVFGVCLLNDWSARDIQAWEYQPLGPFLSKNFASTISPWIITLEALAPFRVAIDRPETDPQPLPYLSSNSNATHGAFDIQLESFLHTRKMQDAGEDATRLGGCSFKHCYWTMAQMVTHHTVNGCNLNAGDLFGSGTQSGASPDQAGSLLELTRGGNKPVQLPNGESRTFIEDGDSVILRGFCEKDGAARIGFGEAIGTILPAKI